VRGKGEVGSGRHLLCGYACHHARRCGAAGFALLVSAVVVLSLASPPGAGAAGESVSAWLTTGDRGKLLEQQSSFNFGGDTSSELVLDVNEHHRYQTMDGFGAALTDSSAWLIGTKLSTGQRSDLLNRLFSPSAGLGLSYLRIPAGASDFSLSHYTYDDTCCDLSDFSVAPDEAHRIPIVLQAKEANSALRLMGSAWSAPAWMKTNGSLYRGALKPEHIDDYATYLGRFADAWAARGAPLSSVTLGNEPQHKPADYPGMWLTPSDEIALVNQLGPGLAGKGMKILTLDHNWALAHYGADVLRDPAARQYVDGTAFHCYGGAPDYQSIVRDAHPDKEIHFTECSSGNWATNWADNLVWDGVNLLVGATRNWARTVLKWNLALDPSHGPHTGGCGGCTGLVTIDPSSGSVSYNHDYYALGHVSKFVSPGAQRIASTARAGDLHSVAFRNPDGSKVLVVVNAGGQGRGFLVRWGGQAFQYSLDKQSIATFRWTGAQGTPGAPAPPAAPVATASDGKVSLKWDFSPHATRYEVRRSAAGGPWTTVATDVALPEHVDTGVVNGTSYVYAVVAVNSVGRSADSAVATAIPGPPPLRSASSQLEAESFDAQSGVGIESCGDVSGCGRSVGYLEDGDYLAWNQVHFGDGATSVSLRVASGGTGGSIELRLGSPTGALIGSVPVASTGGWGSWTTLTAPVSGVSGVQSLYVVFRGPPPETTPDGIANLNWLTFAAGGVPPDPGGPLPRTGWSATASPSGGDTSNALDGNPATRWTSGQGQANGHWFRVDLGSAQSFGRLKLDSGTGGDYPRGLRVEASADGTSWTQVATATGSGQFVEVVFASQNARYLRLVQTGSAGNWWSIHELELFAPTGPPPPPPPDTTAPAITLSGPSTGTQQTSAAFTFSANEPATFRCRLDTAGFDVCASGIAYTGLEAGQHVFQVEATDAAGNVGSRSHTWTISPPPPPPPPDTTPPTISLNGPASGTQQTSATFTFSASEPATFRCRLDAAGFDACASGISYSGLQPGEHVFQVEATDAAGNAGSRSHTWTIAAPPPPPPPVVDTGFLGPLASSADSGGDGNGFETSPSSAHADDGAFAVDTNSGSGTSTSCTSSSKDKHRFRDYGIALPTAASIKGIVVRLDARADSTSGSPKLCVQLSWNGGSSWTSAKTTSALSTSERTYLLGSATDRWGRSWTAANLADTNLRVRVVTIASSTSRDFSLDWVAVKVHYADAPPLP
jgi:glucosylceramidase